MWTPQFKRHCRAPKAPKAQVENAVNQAVAATLTAMPPPTALAVEEIPEDEIAQGVESSATKRSTRPIRPARQTGQRRRGWREITEEGLEELLPLLLDRLKKSNKPYTWLRSTPIYMPICWI